MIKKKITNNPYVLYGGLFLVFFVLFAMVPYSHDEWAWGTQTRLSAFRNFFQGYNGRYFGDLISLAITRSVLFKAAFMSGIMTLLINACVRLAGAVSTVKANDLYGIILALLLLAPTALFAQTYGWPAAFVNFVPPVIAIIWLLWWQFNIHNRHLSLYKQLLLGFFLTLGAEFFSENITIFMVLFSVGLILDALIAHEHVAPWHWMVLATSLIGALLMFINPAYMNAAENTDGYKKISFSFTYLVQKIYSVMIPNMFTNYAWLLLLVAFTLGALFLGKKDTKSYKDWISWWLVSAYPVYVLFFYGKMQFGSAVLTGYLLIAFTIVYFLALLELIFKCLEGVKLRLGLIVTISIGAVSAPLLMADPIGPRSFYGTFIFWVLLELLLLLAVAERKPHWQPMLGTLGNSVALTAMLFYLLTFSYSYYGQINRQRMIDRAIETNQKVLRLPDLPNKQFVWKTSTNEPTWNARFKNFYHIPKRIKVIFPQTPDYAEYRQQIEEKK